MIVKTKYYSKSIGLYDAYLFISTLKHDNTQDEELKKLYHLQIEDAERLISSGYQPMITIGYIQPKILYKIESLKDNLKLYEKNSLGEIVKKMELGDYLQMKIDLGLMILKHAIRGHIDFFDHDGQEIPFKVDSDNLVHDEILGMYEYQSFMVYLPDYVLYFQTLSPEEKKS